MKKTTALIALSLGLLGGIAANTAWGQAQEGDLKAAFVYNFAKFVEWPVENLPAGAPLQVCWFGPADGLGAALPKLEGKAAQGHEIRVRTVQARTEQLKSCHLLVVGDVETPRLHDIIRASNGLAALTVGTSERFVDAGGMIGLVTTNNKVQFEINLEAAQRANLRLVAQFVNLARTVRK